MELNRWGESPVNLIDAAMAYEGRHDQIAAWDYLQASTPSSVLHQFAELYGSLIPHMKETA